MTLKTWMLAAAGALILAFAGSSAQAAPAGGLAAELKSEANRGSGVQEATWRRRCWWHRGHRHCRRYWDDGYGYYYDSYPGPGISFFFDGGRRHHHHGHGHRGHRGHGHHGRGRHH
jgi:hypothetical protein